MAAKKRTAVQDEFMGGELKALIATNAFGLGVDKADILAVMHYQLPGNLESYYQEFGRAGHDGQPAFCELLYDPTDRRLQKYFQARRYADESDLTNAFHALRRLSEANEARLSRTSKPSRRCRRRGPSSASTCWSIAACASRAWTPLPSASSRSLRR